MAKVKKYEGLVLVIQTDTGKIQTHTSESFEKNKDLILKGSTKKFSTKLLNDLPKMVKARAEANLAKIKKTIERRNQSAAVEVSDKVAEEVKDNIEASNEAKEEAPKGDKEGSIATPTREKNTKN